MPHIDPAKHRDYVREYYRSHPVCREKAKEAQRRWRVQNPERALEQARKRYKSPRKEASDLKWRKMNAEKIGDYQRSYYSANKDRWPEKLAARRRALSRDEWRNVQRGYGLKHRHGLTLAQYEEMLKAQEGKCALCGAEYGTVGFNGVLHVDHDHRTGQIRGLLCMSCNHALERVDNCQGWIEKVESYLRRPR